MAGTIPIIDFSDYSISRKTPNHKSQVEYQLFNALSTYGFVYLKHTGILKESVDQVNEVTRLFFEAPVTDKIKYSRDPNTNFGYVGLEIEKVNPFRPGDYKEAFNISGFAFDGINFPLSHWPVDISPQFCNVIQQFIGQCKKLTLNVFEALAVGMQLKNLDYFIESHSLLNKIGNASTLRSLYYPPIKHELKPGQVRLGEHSDYGSLTLLFQDNIGGLQVENLNGKYVDAMPMDDTVLINIGDALEYWSNNKLKSTKHRVLVPEGEKRNTVRRSLAYFVHPDDNVIINERIKYSDQTLNTDNVEQVVPMTALQYLKSKLLSSY